MAKQKTNQREEENNNKKGKKHGILKKILLILLIALIALIGFIIYKTKQNGGGMTGLLVTLVGNDEETIEELEPLQVLLMGMSTDQGAKLTDTIIVGSYDPKTQKASLLSIPRDTFVGTNIATGSGYDKINSLYQQSPQKLLDKVNKLTGLNLEYYMVIDNQALIKLVDVIGGVEFNVPEDMYYKDPSQDLVINLKKGLQILNGDKAEQLVRFRKNSDNTTYSAEYGKDDTGRMRTQREFIIETVKQTIQAKNIFKVKDIIDIAYEYVKTNLSISTIKDYVPYAINVDIDGIQSAVLPGKSVGPKDGASLWYYLVDEEQAKTLMQELYFSDSTENEDINDNGEVVDNTSAENKNPTTENPDEKTTEITKKEASKIKVEILNGSGSDKILSEVKKKLTSQGYAISRTKTTTSTSKTTIINKTDIDEKFENNIKDLLGVGNISRSTVSSSNVDITIIIGKDYK